ncbi:polysaccharide deacetylase family protein [Citromicrobium bathyomarinum]|uniref:polysaccharide deacetylase family protein n=1 Tax=Citromicrobium bathyomarinum TaxID=72174 RepID=UPI00315A7D4E
MRWLLPFLLGLLAACAQVEDIPAPSQPPEKRIALTFDDAPRTPGAFLSKDERTRRLIDSLEKAGVEQAAFFVNPGHIEGPDDERRLAAYVAAGHVLANHSATHPQLSSTDTADYLADIDAGEAWLRGRAGYRAWFRYPYLDEGRGDKAKRDAIRAGLAERGLTDGYVTIDASDWFYEAAAKDAVAEGHEIDREALRDLYVQAHVEAAEFYDKLARDVTGRSPAHVMLLHETDLAALWIADLVSALRAKGWTIVTADEAYADPIAAHAKTYDTPSAQGTLTEMVAWQNGVPAPRWYRGNDTRLAQQWFDTRVLHLPPAEAD